MTGAHTDGPTGQRTARSRAWRIGTPVVGLLCGGLLVVSAVNSEGTDLRPGRYTDLASLVEGEAADYAVVEEEFQELSREVDRLGAQVSDRGVAQTRNKVEELRDPAGLTPRSGAGVQITLSDSPEDVLEQAIDRGKENPYRLRRYVVHQQDIQAVVNALWRGGATAVTIAGQRVISTTGIKCEGNAVQLQGIPYPQPYVIEAVGDQGALIAAVSGDPLVGGFRADSENPLIAIGWDLELADQVTAPAYSGLLDLEYAEPLR